MRKTGFFPFAVDVPAQLAPLVVLVLFADQAARPIELLEAAAAAERAVRVLDRLGQLAAAALIAAAVAEFGVHAAPVTQRETKSSSAGTNGFAPHDASGLGAGVSTLASAAGFRDVRMRATSSQAVAAACAILHIS